MLAASSVAELDSPDSGLLAYIDCMPWVSKGYSAKTNESRFELYIRHSSEERMLISS